MSENEVQPIYPPVEPVEDNANRRLSTIALACSALPIPLAVVAVTTGTFLSIPSVDNETALIVLGLLSCVTGIHLGHVVIHRMRVPVEATRSTRWAMSAITIGYACLLPTLCFFPLVAALIELPWLVVREVEKSPRRAVAAALVVTGIAVAGYLGGEGFRLVGWAATAELALFAGWLPFAGRPEITNQRRWLLTGVLYGLTIITVVIGYLFRDVRW